MTAPRVTFTAGVVALVAIAAIAFVEGYQRRTDTRTRLTVRHDQKAGTITIVRAGSTNVLLTHNVKPDFRPYVHPITAPDGRGVLTELSPAHHTHQTGLYWGFTRLNGRDYFHNPGGDYWRRVSVTVLQHSGREVRWQTVYDLLDD